MNSIETLDVALKTREPAGAVKTLAQDAADRIAVVIGGLQARTLDCLHPTLTTLRFVRSHSRELFCRQAADAADLVASRTAGPQR